MKETPLWAPDDFWERPEDDRRRLINEECGPHAVLDEPPKWAREDFWYCRDEERRRIARRHRNQPFLERVKIHFEVHMEVDWSDIEGVGAKAVRSLVGATQHCRTLDDYQRWLAATDLTTLDHIGPKNGANVADYLELLFLLEDT